MSRVRRVRAGLLVAVVLLGLVLVVRGQWFPGATAQDTGRPTWGERSTSVGAPSTGAPSSGAPLSGGPSSGAPLSGGSASGGPVVPPSSSSGVPEGRTALAALDTLAVKGRAPRTGYDRDAFGQRWSDDVQVRLGRNGCDTRNDVLAEQLTRVRLVDGARCRVASGLLRDPYTGRELEFVRGPRSADVQIDHVVPLALAWQTGAQQLSVEQRADLANDPLNLLATAGAVNQQKGDGDAATWLPPDRSAWCGYAARQIAVKQRYRLWVTPPEKAALQRVLARCPGQPLPTG